MLGDGMAELARIVPRRVSAEDLARENAAGVGPGDARVQDSVPADDPAITTRILHPHTSPVAPASGTPSHSSEQESDAPQADPTPPAVGGDGTLGHDDLKDLHEAFLASHVEAAVAPPSRLVMMLPALIALMLFFTGVWAWFGHLDIVVAAPGKIVPGGKVKVVESTLPGIVRSIHVEDGDHVAKGDPLIDLDPTESDADLEKLTREWLAALLDVAREEALIGAAALASGGAPLQPEELFEIPKGVPAHEVADSLAVLRAEWAALMGERQRAGREAARARATLASLRAEQDKVSAVLPLLTERVDGQRILYEKQLTQKSVYLEHEQVLLETRHQGLVLDKQIEEAQATLASA
ncbi:MAG: biotin/lipoyl-binding protein, partial [Nisaea sp.]